MNPETKIEQKACDLVYRFLGVESSKLVTPGDTGFPDRIFWCPQGALLLIEFKQPGANPEPKQKNKARALRNLGYTVEVHDNAHKAAIAVAQHIENTCLLNNEQRNALEKARRLFKTGLAGKNGDRANTK